MLKKTAVSSTRLRAGVAVCAFLAGIATVIGLILRPADPPLADDPATRPTFEPADPDLIELRTPPINVPDDLPDPPDDIPPDAPVIGVSVNGKHRAYSLAAFEEVSRHVVNDLLADRPVSVTYCPRTGCTRVFTGTGVSRLHLAVGGWYDKQGASQMVIRIGRERYQQETGRAVSGRGVIPHPALDYQATTWGEWQKAHPDSDVYTGGGEVGY